MTQRNESPSGFVIRAHRPRDLDLIVSRHDFLYARDFGWKDDFIGATEKLMAEVKENFDPDLERIFVGESTDTQEVLGSITLIKHRQEPDAAQIRFLLVEPTARGTGIGGRLVREAVEFARAKGYKKVLLGTVSILEGARRIYARAGFEMVKAEEETKFWGTMLVKETWQLDLSQDEAKR